MNESMTVGSLSVLALVLAADAANRGILGEGTRIAYLQLSERVRQCAGDELSVLGVTPSMRARVSSAIEQSIEQRERIKALSRALVESMKADVLQGKLGVSLRRLNVIAAHLEEID